MKPDKKHRFSMFREKRPVHAVDHKCLWDDSSTDGSICTVKVSSVSDPRDPPPPLFCKIYIDDTPVIHQIDPGATVCILPAKFINGREIRNEKVTLRCGMATLSLP